MTGPDSPSLAVVAAQAGAGEWRAAVVAQRVITPDHGDFYSLASELVATLRALEALTCVLGRQVAGYALGRDVRDDESRNPNVRLADAADYLARARESLVYAEREANEFWSAIGHIGVEYEER
jgi:hypothetical protein